MQAQDTKIEYPCQPGRLSLFTLIPRVTIVP